MTFTELKNKSTEFYPAIKLESVVPFKTRIMFRKIFAFFLVIMLALVILLPVGDVGLSVYKVRGLFSVLLVWWVGMYLLEAFYLSYYFKNEEVDFDAARLIYIADEKDLTKSFLESDIGIEVLKRLDVDQAKIKQFIKDESRHKLKSGNFEFTYRKITDMRIEDYVYSLYQSDSDFADFLDRREITTDDLFEVVRWVVSLMWKERNRSCFWSRESLSKIRSVGSNLEFDHPQLLSNYCHLIYENTVYKSLGDFWEPFRKDAEKLERIIIEEKFSNIMLISPDDTSGMEIVSVLGKMIVNGKSLPELENRKIFVFSPESFLAKVTNKKEFEKEFSEMIEQSAASRNIILVIPRIAYFLSETENMKVNLYAQLSKILNSVKITVIAVSDDDAYHDTVEPNFNMMKHFKKITSKKVDSGLIMKIIQDEVHKIEMKDKIFFTYQSIKNLYNKIADENDRELSFKEVRDSMIELHKMSAGAISRGLKVIK